jgi:hypothetical protein
MSTRNFVGTIALGALLLIGLPITGHAADCENLVGSWKQSHFGMPNETMREAGDQYTLVIREVKSDCTFTATFNGGPVRHSITGRIETNSNNQSMIITRTDQAGCTNQLFGSMYILWSGLQRNVAWHITSSEPACGMGANHREARWFRRP